jgi:cyclophilin family peptidyl-prolyl cis-trans isomerase
VRYAAVFGLGRGYVAPAEGSVAAGADAAAKALAARIGDDDAEIRAIALAGLARRKARAVAGDSATGALADDDWRVQVEAIRLTGGDGATEEDARALAALCAREWTRLSGGDAPASTAHVLIEGLHGLAPSVGLTEVRQVLVAIATSSRDTLPADRPAPVRLAANHVRALVHAALARVDDATFTPEQSLAIVEGVQLPDEVIGGLVAEALMARLDAHPADAVAALVARAGADQPPGRRAAMLAVMGDVYPKSPGAAVIDVVLAGIADDRPDVAGSAADAAVAILAEMAKQPMLSAPYGLPQLHQALVDRIATATDPELLSSLLGAAGKALGVDATEACTTAWTHANPAVRTAARECLKTITGADPGPGKPATAARPPVDPASVLGKRLRWTVETTRGTLVVDLDGDAAPWHVAAIVHLTTTGFYDDLLFHRVVPDFVVQGGDPTGTGWGGPGFTLPSEPSALPYDRGAIGIADAGMDTGGSQWFVMHSRAPHLDGRYTVIGHVVDGDRVIDQLLVGDRIVKATVAPIPEGRR